MRSSGIPGFVRVSDKTGSLPEESKRNSNAVFGHQLLSLPLHRKIRKPRRSRDNKMMEKWRALQKRETEKAKGLLIREAIRHTRMRSQKELESDGTATLLCRLSRHASSVCWQRPHGMNAEDEWCCGSSLSMTDLVLPSVSVY